MPQSNSRQPRLQTEKDVQPVYVWTMIERGADSFPAWGSGGRDEKLREFVKSEPILAGALATMTGKATALDWQITGGRNRVKRFHNILGEADDGKGWSYFLDRLVQDYTATDIGGMVELGRESENGPVAGIYNLDAVACTLTGNVLYPIRYTPRIGAGRSVPFKPGDFARIVDSPSTDETKFGLGFCAVSRALKAAKILMALYTYEEEQLSDMPPQGIATVTGMTQAEVITAFDMYNAKRQSREQQTFKGVLWMAATANTLQQIDVKLTPFSTLPPHFDKQQAMTLYIYTLALDFGVDVREFWPASQTGATKAEAEVQAQKAKGKGFGRMVSDIERAVNWEMLPDGLEFSFDLKDGEDDLMRQKVRRESIEAVRRMWEPGMGGAGIISTDEARRLLVEEGVLPEWASFGDTTIGVGSENEVESDMDAGNTVVPDAPAQTGLTDAAIAQKAMRAKLRPGEDLIAMNRQGDVISLWSARRVYVMPLPLPAPEVVPPFGQLRGSRYP